MSCFFTVSKIQPLGYRSKCRTQPAWKSLESIFVFTPSGPHRVAALDLLTGLGESGVLARLFYPTLAETGAGHPYTEADYVRGKLAFANWSRWATGFLCWGFSHLRLCCAWLAPPLTPDGQRLPVVVFSHGLGGQRHVYSSLCVELASHGYLVAAVEHRDGSASMTFSVEADTEADVGDGQRQESPPQLRYRRRWLPMKRHPLNDFVVRHAQARRRADECRQLTDAVLRLARGEPVVNHLRDGDAGGFSGEASATVELLAQFRDRIDTNRIHLMGHSFGAATAITTLATAPGAVYKSCNLLDIWMHPVDPSHYGLVKIPVLFLSNEKFHWETNANRIQAVLDSFERDDAKLNLTIRGTNHAAQTDAGLYLSAWMARRLGLTDAMHPREAVVLTAAICRAFMARHEGSKLSESDTALLSAQHPDCIAGLVFKSDNPVEKKKAATGKVDSQEKQ